MEPFARIIRAAGRQFVLTTHHAREFGASAAVYDSEQENILRIRAVAEQPSGPPRRMQILLLFYGTPVNLNQLLALVEREHCWEALNIMRQMASDVLTPGELEQKLAALGLGLANKFHAYYPKPTQ